MQRGTVPRCGAGRTRGGRRRQPSQPALVGRAPPRRPRPPARRVLRTQVGEDGSGARDCRCATARAPQALGPAPPSTEDQGAVEARAREDQARTRRATGRPRTRSGPRGDGVLVGLLAEVREGPQRRANASLGQGHDPLVPHALPAVLLELLPVDDLGLGDQRGGHAPMMPLNRQGPGTGGSTSRRSRGACGRSPAGTIHSTRRTASRVKARHPWGLRSAAAPRTAWQSRSSLAHGLRLEELPHPDGSGPGVEGQQVVLPLLVGPGDGREEPRRRREVFGWRGRSPPPRPPQS